MRHTLALCLATATVAAAGHLAVPFSRERFSHARAKAKRQSNDGSDDDDDSEPLTLAALNNITGGGYYAEFGVGTPPQLISFLLDTGSSDTWVNSVDADICNSQSMQTRMGFCQAQFDQDESTTFETLEDDGFDITYLDGRRIRGDYFQDNVHIGDATVEEQQLGLALKSVRPSGIMGLGFGSNVAADRAYATIIDNLLNQGFIDAPAYSLYLNDLSTDSGNILFGGIDTQKFIGKLQTLPLFGDMGEPGAITSFNVQLDGFDVQTPDGEMPIDLENLNSYAILDSGSTINLLPDDQVQPIWEQFGVLAFEDVLAPFVDCAYAEEKGQGYVFEFRFANKTIQVPMDEMVINAYDDIQDQIFRDPTLRNYFRNWTGACMFGIGSTLDFGIDNSNFTLLGATFLRSAYVVYDLANEQLAIAQANLNSQDEDIVEITSGDLPDVTGVDRQSPTSSSTTPSSSTPTPTSSNGGDDDSADGASTTTTDSSSGTGTDSGSGASNTDSNDEGASVRASPPIVAVSSLMGLFAVAFVLL